MSFLHNLLLFLLCLLDIRCERYRSKIHLNPTNILKHIFLKPTHRYNRVFVVVVVRRLRRRSVWHLVHMFCCLFDEAIVSTVCKCAIYIMCALLVFPICFFCCCVCCTKKKAHRSNPNIIQSKFTQKEYISMLYTLFFDVR